MLSTAFCTVSRFLNLIPVRGRKRYVGYAPFEDGIIDVSKHQFRDGTDFLFV